eukprot:4408494-Ditylum_brightwellii.AAC.1
MQCPDMGRLALPNLYLFAPLGMAEARPVDLLCNRHTPHPLPSAEIVPDGFATINRSLSKKMNGMTIVRRRAFPPC